jgi:hypothetical protein
MTPWPPTAYPALVMGPRLLPTLVLAAVLVAACNSGIAPTLTPTDSAAPASAAPTTEPATSDEPTEPPASEETPSEATETPPPVDEPSASASSGPGPAAACSGNDKNRDFFVAAAAALNWPVYCAVLPAGWFVDSGEYRRAAGGRLEIAYKGPGGARLELREGAFCTIDDGCVKPGTENGEASFGDRTGTLVGLDDGGWVIIVDRVEPVSWLAVGHGMDEEAFRAIAAALSVVSG